MSNVWTFINALTKVLLPRVWRGLWYWNTVEERLLLHVMQTAVEGDPASVLAAMDEFNAEQWMMSIEYEKREKIEAMLSTATTAPKVCLELGTYCGYSAIVIGRQLPAGSRLITVEKNSKTTLIARQIIKFAGVDQVTVYTSNSNDFIKSFRSRCAVDKLDFVFIDHQKDLYLPDLKLLEEHQLLRRGTVLVADNTLWPGAPGYLKYVETCHKYDTERAYFTMALFNVEDAMAISVYRGPTGCDKD